MLTFRSLCVIMTAKRLKGNSVVSRRLSPNQKVDIVNAYIIDLVPMIKLAEQYNVSRAAIYKIIRKAGVDTSAQSKMMVTCTACGTEIERTRGRIRKNLNHFCDQLCYSAYFEAGNGHGPYIQNRHGQRLARIKVSEYFDLQPTHVVHHIDRNCLNNMLNNLMVFANQGDHIRYHRLGSDYVQPLWVYDDPGEAR